MKLTQCYFLILITIVFNSSFSIAGAKLKEFESTRTMQTANAGVGSILINETTLLNPASIAFIGESTMYYQKNTTNLDDKSTNRPGNYKEGRSEFLSFSDTTTPLKGGFSYLYQNEEYGKRTRYALSSAGNITKTTSFGISYKYTDEVSEIIEDSYHQFTLGFTHILNEDIVFGLVIVDPQRKIEQYSHFTLGFQYNLNPFISFMADVGSGDNKNTDKESFSRYALQINSFKYFFFRTGRFHDKFNNIRGFSYGLSWVGPKFAIDYAIKNSELISETSEELFKGEQLVETSFAISALF